MVAVESYGHSAIFWTFFTHRMINRSFQCGVIFLRFAIGIAACKSIVHHHTGATQRPHNCRMVAVRPPYDFVIFLHPEKSHDARSISMITVQAPHDVRTVVSRSHAICTILWASYRHHLDIPQSVSSKIYKHRAFGVIIGHKEDERDEDAVNACSRCEAGKHKAAAVAG